jgi:hypothetical protein
MKICKKFKKGKNYVTANALKMEEEEEATQRRNNATAKLKPEKEGKKRRKKSDNRESRDRAPPDL